MTLVAFADADGLPITLKLAEGQAHDGKSAGDLLDALAEGQILVADRAVATRYDKLPENFLAGVKLASLRIWMRFNESMT